MILAPNPQQPLNGNKGLLLFFLSLGFIGFLNSCTFTRTVFAGTGNPFPHNIPGFQKSNTEILKQHFGGSNPTVANFALLLPFNFNSLNTDPNSPLLHSSIENNALVWDFYEGFILAMDSVGRYNQDHGLKGLDLTVMDTGEDSLSLYSILLANPLDAMDLVIGPLYPEQVKQMSSYSIQKKKYFISPVSPQPLSNFNNPYLIMINSPLEAYSIKTVEFIQEHNTAANILILDSSPLDQAYYGPMLNHFLYPPRIIKLKGNNFNSEKIPLSSTLPNILIVPSLDKVFWAKLAVFLGGLNTTFTISVFAHPNFSRLNFNDQDLLQTLHVHYPSNYFLNKEDPDTQKMQVGYKNRFQTNPTEFSFLGYDIGMYFGRTLTTTDSLESSLIVSNWKGIHNDFQFVKDSNLGFWNKSIKMVEYINNTLQEDK